jgi:hypothetical protein
MNVSGYPVIRSEFESCTLGTKVSSVTILIGRLVVKVRLPVATI